MLAAHLPGGYLLTTGLLKWMKVGPATLDYRKLMWVGIIASILPDFDLLYWLYVDNRQTFHHRYYTHTPYFWFCMFGTGLLVSSMVRSRLAYQGSVILLGNTMLHMVLDSFTGSIRWAWPFDWNTATTLFAVPSHHDWWVWNFILHPTFLVEILVVVSAFTMWCRRNVQHYRNRSITNIKEV